MENVMKRKDIAIISTIIWMALIFFLSHQPASASSNLSGSFVQLVLYGVQRLPVAVDETMLHFFVRKIAHFGAYFILGILIFHVIRLYRGVRLQTIIYAFFIAIVYAASDEWHQTFVPGRSGELRDVFIDGAGSLMGIACYISSLYVWCFWANRKKTNRR